MAAGRSPSRTYSLTEAVLKMEGFARVVSFVRWSCISNNKMTLSFSAIFSNSRDSTSGRVISHHFVVKIPEDISWGFRTVRNYTCEVNGGSPVDVKVWRSLDSNMWHYNI